MTRAISVGMAAHLADTSHTRCLMLRLDLVDGSSIGMTDHDLTLNFDLGDGAIDYLPDTGIKTSDLALSTGFEADDVEFSGPITGDRPFTFIGVKGGRFDDAVVRLFEVNWSDLTEGAIDLVQGFIVKSDVDGDQFKLTVNSEASKMARTFGFVTSAYCRYTFGVNNGISSFCPATPTELDATVTGVDDALGFAVSHAGTLADGAYDKGLVRFLTGELDGTRPVEIARYTSAGAGAGLILLDYPLAEAPVIGDTLKLVQGCGHTRPDCVAILGDAVDFGGEPDLPGMDRMVSYPNPGASTA